jgi:hypothetical protein
MARCYTTALLNDNCTFLIFNIEDSDFATQTLWIQLEGLAVFFLVEDTGIKEHTENFFRIVTQGT